MKFNFKIQQYQTDAVDAVINVFNGQGFHDKTNYIRDLGNKNQTDAQMTINLLNFLTSSYYKIFIPCKVRIT